MIIFIIFAYWFIGFCYLQAISIKDSSFLSLAINLFLALIWPYFMLVRMFQHIGYIAQMKREKAFKEKNNV